MAITNLRIVTGTAGGENGISNVGTGADVTWPIAGNPSLANTGLFYTSAEGCGIINLTTPSDRGIHYAWGAQGDGDDQPAWATGPGYIEIPAAATNQRVEFLTSAEVGAISDANLTAGLSIKFGIQFAISGTYAAGTLPQHNNTAIAIMQADQTAQSFQLRCQSRNIENFAPGIALSCGNPYDAGAVEENPSTPMGSLSSNPMVELGYNKWYQFEIIWQAATNGTALNGEIHVLVNGQKLFQITAEDCWYGTKTLLGRLIGLLSGYTTAITGCKIRYCPPIMVRIVPAADRVPDWHWEDNTADDRDLARWYPAAFTGEESPWTISGTAMLPSVGTAYATTGVTCGRDRFVIPGTAAQTFALTLNTDIWDGGADDSPIGTGGYVWYRFTDLYHDNNCDITVFINALGAGPADVAHTIELKSSDNTLTIDGVEVQDSLATSTRFEILVGMRPGNTVVLLHDITNATKLATKLRRYVVANGWGGTSLGAVEISGTFSGSVSANVGPVGIYRKMRFLATDSYVGSPSNTALPVFNCATGHLGKFWNQGCDSTVPNGWDPGDYPIGGIFGVDIGCCIALSGGKLSEDETHIWPNLTGFPFHGLLIGGTINDITRASATFEAANTSAEVIANRIVDWCDLCVNSGGTSIVIDTLNVASGSATGGYTAKAMCGPTIVADKLPGKLAARRYRRGSVTHVNPVQFLEANTDHQGADGAHPATASALVLGGGVHRARKIRTTADGYDADGSIARSSSGASGGMILGMIGN